MIKTSCSYKRDSTQIKQKWNKIKIGIFTVMFFMQNFCLHHIRRFSRSYRKIERTWSTAKCRGRKSFDTWYLVTCATLCVSFYRNRKQSMFFQTFSEIESTWPVNSSNQKILLSHDSNELFVQPFVKVFDQNWKHVEAQNQRTGTPAYFTVPR